MDDGAEDSDYDDDVSRRTHVEGVVFLSLVGAPLTYPPAHPPTHPHARALAGLRDHIIHIIVIGRTSGEEI